MSKYLPISDEDFYSSINKNFKQYKIPKKKLTMENICFPDKFTYQIPQLFAAEFINPKTDYLSLLVYHEIGSGKTCTAIKIAENFKYNTDVVVVLPASLIDNFRTELRSQCGGNTYLTEANRKKLSSLPPSSKEYKSIIADSDDLINSYYKIYSYHMFIKDITSDKLNLSNSLLIIDEVHNLISETGVFYEKLYKTVHAPSHKNMRIVAMTADPIYNKPSQLALTMNILLKDKQLPIGVEFDKTFIDTRITDNGPIYNIKNVNLLKAYCKGIISYYRGAPKVAYPKSKFNIVKVKMSEKQRRLYSGIIKDKNFSISNDYLNLNVSNSFFIHTRLISNFAFPNNELGEKGYESLRPSDFKPKNLIKYSPKFAMILEKLNNCKGIAFVYSNFKKYAGVLALADMLLNNGYKNYATDGPGENRFVIFSGDQNSDFKAEAKAVINNYANRTGSNIKIILGSPSVKEGISFLRVQEIHIVDPYWNMSRINQIKGRGLRFCSHKDVPKNKRMVNVYIYLSVHDKIKKSVDQYIMDVALSKQHITSKFIKVMKENAIDCGLFHNINSDKENPITCDI